MKIVFFLFLILGQLLQADSIDLNQNYSNILSKSQIYIDTDNLNFQEVQKSTHFQDFTKPEINLGFVRNTQVWVRLKINNSSSQTETKILEVKNPLLEDAKLYTSHNILHQGLLHHLKSQKTLNPSFEITLRSGETKTFYLEVRNSATSLRFELALLDKVNFLKKEFHSETFIYIFFTIVIMLFAYNGLLAFYTKEVTYGYYSLYLFTVLFQQATYLGITQMYMPEWFVYYDNLSVLFKVNSMYIAAALFAKSFLLTKNHPLLDKIYTFFILASLIEMPIFGTPLFYYPEVGIITALFFVFFNMFAGISIYLSGYKQARLFVIGWGFLVVGFVLMILDGLGLISVMQELSEIVMILLSFEAIVLSLAFVDNYMILRSEKSRADKLLLSEYKNRQKIIESEIEKQTYELKELVENKQTLLKELQHRTKNNLQLILSLVRIQATTATKETQKGLQELENRINTIAKTDEKFYMQNSFERINMQEYVQSLCDDLNQLSKKELIIKINTHAVYLPIREAGYIGLIINEIVTNSIKYVGLPRIVISVDISKRGNNYSLDVRDNGAGFDVQNSPTNGIGIELIKTLAQNQLDGELKIKVKNGLIYTIGFSL